MGRTVGEDDLAVEQRPGREGTVGAALSKPLSTVQLHLTAWQLVSLPGTCDLWLAVPFSRRTALTLTFSRLEVWQQPPEWPPCLPALCSPAP